MSGLSSERDVSLLGFLGGLKTADEEVGYCSTATIGQLSAGGGHCPTREGWVPCKESACLGWAGGHLRAEGKVMDQAGPWVWAEVPSLLLSVATSPHYQPFCWCAS